MCAARLKFADGTACVVMLESRDNSLQLLESYVTNIDGRDWVTGWRVDSQDHPME